MIQRSLLILFLSALSGQAFSRSGPPKDTMRYTLAIRYISYNGKIYDEADSAMFSVSCNIPDKLPEDIRKFRQDEVSYFKNGSVFYASVVRIGQPSESLLQGHDVDISIIPKGQVLSGMSIHSYGVRVTPGNFKKGVNYIIDTLYYECGSAYFNIPAINEDIKGSSAHIRPAHFIRLDHFPRQYRTAIDSVLKQIGSELEADKKLAELNKGKELELRTRKSACTDTITRLIRYHSGPHQEKDIEFDDGGNVFRTVIYDHPLRLFFKTCGWTEGDHYRCDLHIIGRDTEVKVIIAH